MARIVRNGELVRVPWKNGGGTTAEVAAFPPGANMDAFGWRISMADVSSDGPFSVFPGIDRTLVLVEGAAVELDVEGISYRLDRNSPKLSFSGEDRTVSRLVSGPIRDLNVMTRAGEFTHRTRFMGSGVAILADDTVAAFITPIDGPLDVTLEQQIHSLQPLDTLCLHATQELIQLSGSGRTLLVEIAPAQVAG
jgi:environmental stress-induced protein Ves